MTELQEVAVCLAPLCLELVAPLARLAILALAAVRASWLAFSWAACAVKLVIRKREYIIPIHFIMYPLSLSIIDNINYPKSKLFD